jgi:hypothetical protein
MTDYIPKKFQDLKVWANSFVSILGVNAAQVGLAPADITPLETAAGDFDTALANWLQQETLAHGAMGLRNSTRDQLVALIRPVVRRIQEHPGMTEQLRNLLHIPLPSTGRTPSEIGPEVPEVLLESVAGRVIVHFGDDPGNERNNGKPAWAKGCNIWRKKNGEESYTLVNFANSSPYHDYVSGPAADYTYVVQYRGTKTTDTGGESNPQTIAASGQLAA